MKEKIIFWGTGDFAVPPLKQLIKSNCHIIAVVTSPDKPVGRKQELKPSPVKELALSHHLTIVQPANIKEPLFLDRIKILNPDLSILVAYGKIIPPTLLEIPKLGFINLHASLLPKFRGPSPIQFAILEGEKETGVTIIKLDEGVDTGPILGQQKINIEPKETFKTLHDKLADLGAKLLNQILPQYLENQLTLISQDETLASKTKILNKEDGQINWSHSAEIIERQTRAFGPWPGSFCLWKDQRLIITKARVLNPLITCADNEELGRVFLTANQELAITCGQGSLIIEKLKLEGRKENSAAEFLRGHPDFLDSRVKIKKLMVFYTSML